MEHLFDPYVTTKSKGTGLGLAIVKKLVEEHGGTVAAENPRQGGACVIVRLPIGESPKRRLAGRSARASGTYHAVSFSRASESNGCSIPVRPFSKWANLPQTACMKVISMALR